MSTPRLSDEELIDKMEGYPFAEQDLNARVHELVRRHFGDWMSPSLDGE